MAVNASNLIIKLALQQRQFASEINQAKKKLVTFKKDVNLLNNALKNTYNITDKYVKGIKTFATQHKVLAAAVGVAGALMTKQFIEGIAAIEVVNSRIKTLTGTTEKYVETQGYLKETANRLSVDLNLLSQSYSKILAIQEAGVVTTEEGRKILEGFSNIAAATGATTDQLRLSLFGMTQGLTTAMLRAEELNQTTEALPGLLQKLDEAAGLSSGGFRRLVVEGKVTSEFFKETLIKALESYSGAAEVTAGNIIPTMIRLGNSFKALQVALQPEISPVIFDTITGFSDIVNSFVNITENAVAKGNDFFTFLSTTGTEINNYLTGIATALPRAFELVDFSGLIASLNNVKSSIANLFGGLNLTEPEGLANTIQFLVDVLEQLIDTSAGYIAGIGPSITAGVGLIELFNSIGVKVDYTLGVLIGFIDGLKLLAPVFSAIGFAVIIGGFTLLSAAILKNIAGIVALRLGLLTLIPSLGSVVAALGAARVAALAFMASIGPIGWLALGVTTGITAVTAVIADNVKEIDKVINVNEEYLGILRSINSVVRDVDAFKIPGGEGIISDLKQIRHEIQQGNLSHEEGIEKIKAYQEAIKERIEQEKNLQNQISKQEARVTQFKKSLTTVSTTVDERIVTQSATVLKDEYGQAYDAIALKAQKSHTKASDAALKYAEKYRQRMLEIEDEISGARQSHEEFVRDKRRETMGEIEAEADRKKEIEEKLKKASEARAAGDLKSAKELTESAQQQARGLEDAALSIKLAETAHAQLVSILKEEKQNAAEAANKMEDIARTEATLEVKAEISAAQEKIQTIQNELNALRDKTITVTINQKTNANTGGAIGLNSGGQLSGHGTKDTVPAMLTPGEYVVTANQNRSFIARRLLDFVNFGSIGDVKNLMPHIGFNAGGIIPNNINNITNNNYSSNEGIQTIRIVGNNGQRATLRGERDEITRFKNILREALV